MKEEIISTSEANSELDLISRLRTIEGRYNLLRDRVLMVNQNMISAYKKSGGEIDVLKNEIKDIKSELFQIKETLKHLIKEIELFARKEDVRYLEKYINFWNPLKLITKDEVLKLIEKKEDERK